MIINLEHKKEVFQLKLYFYINRYCCYLAKKKKVAILIIIMLLFWLLVWYADNVNFAWDKTTKLLWITLICSCLLWDILIWHIFSFGCNDGIKLFSRPQSKALTQNLNHFPILIVNYLRTYLNFSFIVLMNVFRFSTQIRFWYH